MIVRFVQLPSVCKFFRNSNFDDLRPNDFSHDLFYLFHGWNEYVRPDVGTIVFSILSWSTGPARTSPQDFSKRPRSALPGLLSFFFPSIDELLLVSGRRQILFREYKY